MNVKNAPMNVCGTGILGIAGACIGMLLSVQAHALSLGAMQVQSALDEPLKAEIPLKSADAETLQSLQVTLGSEQDFQRADVPRAKHLSQLQFSVSDRGGEPVVLVATEQPVKEPFLHFLVAVEWSGGKLVREYTGLLDPPLYSGRAPASIASPGGDPASPAVGEADSPQANPAVGEPVSSSSAVGRSAEYGPTRQGDTLWEIASKLDTGPLPANVFQVMIALLRQNPDAFIDNNVNRLKTGQTLRLQNIEVVAEVSVEEASRLYAAQLEQWRAYKTRIAAADGEPATSAGAASGSAAVSQKEGEPTGTADVAVDGEAAGQAGAGEDVLRIVQAEAVEAGHSQGASAGSDPAGELGDLQTRIASLEETLESRTLENEELRERVRLLESQLANAQRLVEIENQELAAVQQQAAAQSGDGDVAAQTTPDTGEQRIEDTAPAAAGSDAQVPAPAESGQQTQAQAEDQAQAQAQASDTQPGQQVASAAGQASTAGAESGGKVRKVVDRPAEPAWWTRIPDLVFSSWVSMTGAALGVLVLVLGLLIFMRRRQSIAEFEESILSGSALDSRSQTSDSVSASASDTSFLSDFGNAGMGTMQADEVDPLAEAEVYLAYGRDEQAEDVLKEAARRDPERVEIKLKLMEIHKQRGDIKAFETLAEELYPAGDREDPEVWHQVAEMGRELNPDNPLFQDTSTAPVNAGGQAGSTMSESMADKATYPGSAAAGQQEASRRAPTPASKADSFDFDLDALDTGQPMNEAPAETAATGKASAGNGENAPMDFSDFELQLDSKPGTAASGGGDRLNAGNGSTRQSPGEVDPGERPFPAPDEQADLDRELERLASEREVVSAEVAKAEAGVLKRDEQRPDSPDLEWETADTDSEILDFPAGDSSEIEFDLSFDDNDDNSVQHGSGETAASASALPSGGKIGSEDTLPDTANEGVLEFESDNIPPETTWADASSDSAPLAAGEQVTYESEQDVRSSEARPYNEAETKLDLARAYMDMGDKIGARSIIDEVMREGDPSQRDRAADLASRL